MRYQPRDKDIVWEVSEGEVLLIDLVRCIYYSARQGTAQLVHDLMHGHNAEEIAARWLQRFPSGSDPTSHLNTILQLFITDELIKEREQAPAQPGALIELESSEFTSVERYDDMKEIFEMDPIHDGDTEHGWPVHN